VEGEGPETDLLAGLAVERGQPLAQ
jgi:hypothetical protein